jgi:hypothetical protein
MSIQEAVDYFESGYKADEGLDAYIHQSNS